MYTNYIQSENSRNIFELKMYVSSSLKHVVAIVSRCICITLYYKFIEVVVSGKYIVYASVLVSGTCIMLYFFMGN